MRVSVTHLNDYKFCKQQKKTKRSNPTKRKKKTKKNIKQKNIGKTKKEQKKKKQNKKKKTRASSLGPKPSSVFFCCFVSFPFFASNRPKTLFSPRKGHFMFVFACLPFLSLSLFWPPPFFSLSLSLFLSFYLSFFLLVFLFCFL